MDAPPVSAARRLAPPTSVLTAGEAGERREDEKEGRLHAANIMSVHCLLQSMIIKFHDA